MCNQPEQMNNGSPQQFWDENTLPLDGLAEEENVTWWV
jgi:hypothetical protein